VGSQEREGRLRERRETGRSFPSKDTKEKREPSVDRTKRSAELWQKKRGAKKRHGPCLIIAGKRKRWPKGGDTAKRGPRNKNKHFQMGGKKLGRKKLIDPINRRKGKTSSKVKPSVKGETKTSKKILS